MPAPTYNPDVADLALVSEVVDFIYPALAPTDANKLQLYLTSVSKWIASYLARVPLQVQAYTEIRNGTGQSTMPLTHYPVVSVSQVQFLFPGGSSLSILDPSLYAFDTQFLYIQNNSPFRIGRGAFPKGMQNVVVNYVAGFYTPGQAAQTPTPVPQPAGSPNIPEDLKLAAIEMTSAFYKRRTYQGTSSTGVGPERISYDLSSMPKIAASILNSYKNVAPVGVAGPGY